MTNVSSSLSDLVELLNDGIVFYRDAAARVSDPALVDVMQQMGNLKRAIAADLNAEIVLEGDTARDQGSWFGAMRRTYGDLLSRFGERDTDRDLVAQLESHEDLLLAAFREATLADASPRVRDLALNYFPEIEAMHARMRDLKRNGAAATRA